MIINQFSLANVVQSEHLALKLIENIIDQLNNLTRSLVRIIIQKRIELKALINWLNSIARRAATC